MKRTAIIVLMVISNNSFSDMTGAGDAALLTQLITMTTTLNESLTTIKEATDLTKKLENMEQATWVKEVSKAGRQINEIANNVDDSINTVEDIKSDPLGLDATENEIESIKYAMERADVKEGTAKARAYGRTLRDLERMRFVGQTQKSIIENKQEGENADDALKNTSDTSLMMLDIARSNEERKLRKSSNEVTALTDLLSNE
jgi:hypothetical protein